MRATLILLAAAAASVNGDCLDGKCCLVANNDDNCKNAGLSTVQEARVCCKSGETCCKVAAFASAKATCCKDSTHTCTSEVCVPKEVTTKPTPAPTVRKSILASAQQAATAPPTVTGFAGASCRDNCGKKNREVAPFVNTQQLNMYNFQYANAWPTANVAQAAGVQAAAGRRQFTYPTTTASANTQFYFPTATAAPAARGEEAVAATPFQFPQYTNWQPQCSCDSECTRYNDCCSDYSYYCPRGGATSSARPTKAVTSDTCDFAAVRAGAYASLAKANQAALYLKSKYTQEYDVEQSFHGDAELRSSLLAASHSKKADYAAQGVSQAIDSANAAITSANNARDNALKPTLFAKSSVVQIECKLAQANTQMAMDLAAHVEPFAEAMLKHATSRRRLLDEAKNDKQDDAMDTLLDKAETFATLATSWAQKSSVYGAIATLLDRAETQWKYLEEAGPKALNLKSEDGVKDDNNKSASEAEDHQDTVCDYVNKIAKGTEQGDNKEFTDTDGKKFDLTVKSTYTAIIDLLKSAKTASETLTTEAEDAFYQAEAAFHMVQGVYNTVHKVMTNKEFRQGNYKQTYHIYDTDSLTEEDRVVKTKFTAYPSIDAAATGATFTDGCIATLDIADQFDDRLMGCFPDENTDTPRYFECSQLPAINPADTLQGQFKIDAGCATFTAADKGTDAFTASGDTNFAGRPAVHDQDVAFDTLRLWAPSKDGTAVDQGSSTKDYGLYRPYKIAAQGLEDLVAKFGNSADTTYDAFLAYSEGKDFDKIKEAVKAISAVEIVTRAPTGAPTVTKAD